MFGKRLSRALVAATATSLILVSMAFADTLVADGDILNPDTNLSISGAACDTLPDDYTVRGTITHGGSAHFADGAVVSISAAPDAAAQLAGITTSGAGTVTLQSDWATGATTGANKVDRVPKTLNMTVSIPAGIADGIYKVNMSASGAQDGGGTLNLPGTSGNIFFNVEIDCEDDTPPPVNQAPTVTAAWSPDSIGCRVNSTLNVNFTDADSTSWTAAIDWEYDGTNFDNAESIGSVTPGPQVPSFAATHAYNSPGTYTAAVQVTDNQGLVGSATDDLTVNQTYSAAFLAPLDGSTPSKLIANTMKKGRVVPVKVTIKDDCTLAMVNDPTTAVAIAVKTATFTPTSTDAVETFSDAGQSAGQEAYFRWTADSSIAGGGFWIFNLDSNGLQIGTCYEVRAKVGTIAASNYALLKPTK